MAGAPHKVGLTYFSHDTSMSDDIKLQFVEAETGIEGYGVYNKILELIYKDQGYYIEMDERTKKLLSKKFSIEYDKFCFIILICTKEKLFSEKLYKKYSILTSEGIQKRYLRGCDRRKNINLINEYIMLTKIVINDNINGNNVNIYSINDNINSINVAKRKENKINKKESKNKVKEIIDYLNNKSQKNYKYGTQKTIDCINARLNEGFIVDEFKKVIDNKCDDWINSENDLYLRPETLFGNKFEGYLNQNGSTKQSKPKSHRDLSQMDYEYEPI